MELTDTYNRLTTLLCHKALDEGNISYEVVREIVNRECALLTADQRELLTDETWSRYLVA